MNIANRERFTDLILELADVYLDINHWNEVDDIIGHAFGNRKTDICI